MPSDLGWLAGIIDGEGTIALAWSKDCPWVRISIPSTTQAIIDKTDTILNDLAVKHSVVNNESRGSNLPLSSVYVHGHAAYALLQHLRPHLVRQVERANAAMAFFAPHYSGLTARGEKRERSNGWTEEERQEWDAIRSRLVPNGKRRVVPDGSNTNPPGCA